MSRDSQSYLEDILEACQRIRHYTVGMDQSALVSNQMAYDAVLRNLEIIGEAAKRIHSDVRLKMPQIEWTKIAGMRDWLAHAYFQVNADIVWDVIESKLPELEFIIQAFRGGRAP